MNKQLIWSITLLVVTLILACGGGPTTTTSPKVPDLDKLSFVLVAKQEAAYTVYVGIPKDIAQEDLAEIRVKASAEEGMDIISWQDFKQDIDQHVTARIVKDEYEDSQVVKGITELIQKHPGGPFGLTWNGGVAITFNDYQHTEKIYQQYQDNPDEYEQNRKQDPRGDPIHPQNHFGPLLGW